MSALALKAAGLPPVLSAKMVKPSVSPYAPVPFSFLEVLALKVAQISALLAMLIAYKPPFELSNES